ncbi:hypothetical protein V8C86DRAFT_109557 [Haematococcus lacustris]
MHTGTSWNLQLASFISTHSSSSRMQPQTAIQYKQHIAQMHHIWMLVHRLCRANAPQGSLRLSLMSTGALPKWWVLGLRLIFVNAGPLACVAYQLTVVEQGTSVWATSMYSLLSQAVQMILLVVAMCSFFSLRFRAGCFKWATGAGQ